MSGARPALRAALAVACAERTLVTIERAYATDPSFRGYVLAVGARLVLLQHFHEFVDDGWIILALDDIDAVVRGDEEEFFEGLLVAEGVPRRAPPCPLDLDSFAAVLASIRAAGLPASIDCTAAPDDDDDPAALDDLDGDFYLGMVRAVTDLHLTVCEVDVDGHWDTPPPIAMPRLIQIQLDSHYLRTFLRYADPMPFFADP
jgi:hypothetical protein